MAEVIVEPPARRVIVDLLNEEYVARGINARAAGRRVAGRCTRITLSGGADAVSRVLTTPYLTVETFDRTEEGADELMRITVAIIRAAAHTTRPDGTQLYEVGTFGSGTTLTDPDGDREGAAKCVRVVSVGMRATAQ